MTTERQPRNNGQIRRSTKAIAKLRRRREMEKQFALNPGQFDLKKTLVKPGAMSERALHALKTSLRRKKEQAPAP